MSTLPATPDPSRPSLPDVPPPPLPDMPQALMLRIRKVHRAVADLRRGTAVVIDGANPLVVLAAESAGASGLAEFAALRAGGGLLLLAPARASAVLGRPVGSAEQPVALLLHQALFDPTALRTLADPTAERLFVPEIPAQARSVPAAAPAALALAKLARLLPAVLVAPLDRALAAGPLADGTILSVPDEDVLAYPTQLATRLVKVAEAPVPLAGAETAATRIVAFRAPDAGIEHLAIVIGTPEREATPLVRIHSECFTGDLLDSLRCDCGPQLRGAIARMGQEGHGVLLYLAQEGRGIGLVNKLRAYVLQDAGLDTLDANRALGWGADERNFLIAAAMLQALEIDHVRLLTNNPDKLAALAACGISVAGREPHGIAPNGINDRYLATKASRFGHLLDF